MKLTVELSENEEKDIFERVKNDVREELTEGQMLTIATRIYEERITSHVDKILERRNGTTGSVTDQILAATVERYVDKLSDKFEEDFLNRVKKEIQSEISGNEEDTSFQQLLLYKLSSSADKYIDANLSIIYECMESTIKKAAKSLAIGDLAIKISRKINIGKIVAEIISDNIKENQ